MGINQSRPEGELSLDHLSVEDVQNYVTNLGEKYRGYGNAIASNAVDGEVLMEMENVEEFKALLSCLDVTNFVHQKVLLKEWKKHRSNSRISVKMPNLERRDTSSDASEITMDTALSTTHTSIHSKTPARRYSSSEETIEIETIREDEERNNQAPPPLSISSKQKQVLEPLQYSKDTTVLPADSPLLQPYKEVADQLLAQLNGEFAQVNILDVDMPPGTNKRGVNNLATAPCNARMHFDQPNDNEICRRFILQGNQDFHVQDISIEISTALGMKERARYYGHIVQHGNVRVGTVCILIQETPGKATTMEQKQEFMAALASLVQGQLSKRETLLQRAQNLKADLKEIYQTGTDPVLAPAFGPIGPIKASQVARRDMVFPYPKDSYSIAKGPNGCPRAQYKRRSASLPAFQPHFQATSEERSHVHPTVNPSDFPFDPVPIAKHDMERVALLQSLQLLNMTPDCQEAKTIQSLVQMLGELLPVDAVYINFMDHQNSNLLFVTFFQEWPELQAIVQGHPVVQYDTETNKPFHYQPSRSGGMCNYVIAMPNHQTFVVHDTSQDQSLCFMHDQATIGFYAGAPIVIRGQSLGVLGCIRRKPCPEFGQVQELQLEQFAHLIAQQYETWALNREVQQLERQRNLFSHCAETTPAKSVLPPQDYVALVFTSVANEKNLREANESAMAHAMTLHDKVVELQMVQHGGYLVSISDGGAFQIAFSDVVDAIKFCLKLQEALQEAPWRSDLLALPRASETGAFRGLRVKMAIHCGDIECIEQDDGRVAYSGETFYIAKNLGAMGHGGQILATSDVWNVASSLVNSDLGAPQVLDLGAHVMATRSSSFQDGITTKTLLQLVPASLSYDYRQSRRLGARECLGRTFPRIKTKKSVGASFHDAPYAHNKVALVYVDTKQAEAMISDPGMLSAALSKRIGAILREQQPDGYQCDSFLLSFEDSASAIRFGLSLQQSLSKEDVLDLSLDGIVKIGVHEGTFETMGPHPVTGRAEYQGDVVDRVTLIAQAAVPGGVCLGKVAEDMDMFSLQPATNGYMLSYSEHKLFEGVDEAFSLYKCHSCKSWYDQMMDKRNGRNSLQNPWRANVSYAPRY